MICDGKHPGLSPARRRVLPRAWASVEKGSRYSGVGCPSLLSPARSGTRLAIGLLLPVELEPRFPLCLVLGVGNERIRLGLPFPCRVEVARLGVGRGQGGEKRGVLPSGQLARLRGRLDGFLAVAVFLDGTGGPDPSPMVIGGRIVRIDANGFTEIGDGLAVCVQGLPGETAAVV